MRRKILIIPCLLVLLSINPVLIHAQRKNNLVTVDVSGYVMDDAGTPLSGILVKAGKSTETAITDENGKFSIKAGVIDHIGIKEEGYKSISFDVYDGVIESDSIVLQRANYFSEENDVDFPFGSVGISRSTGSVIKISGDQIRKHPSGQVLEALTGLIPGLMIQQTSSRPGSEGYSTSYHGKPVQVLIDGFPQQLHISLREIEEVVMMRGAAATAMMGDLGTDGILLVKTKKGKAGPRQLSFEYESGYGTPTTMGEYMNSYDYATAINQSLMKDGLLPIYGTDALNAYQNGSNPLRYPDVDYVDEFFRNNVTRQQFNAQVSGGTQNSRYFANFSYNGFQGLEKLNEKRNGKDLVFRTNLDLDITENVNLDASLVGSFQQQRQPNLQTGDVFGHVSSYPPNAFPLSYGDTAYITSREWPRNLLFEMREGGYLERTDRRMNMNLGLNIDLQKVLKGLSFNAKVAIDIWNQIGLELDHTPDEYELIFEPRPAGDTMIINKTNVGKVQLNPSDAGEDVQRRYNYFLILNYDKIFNDHAFSANLLFYQHVYEVDNRINNNNGRMFNFRTNYSFKEKYALEAVLAYVGTNKLLEKNRYRLFPTVGASWLLSNESFLENSNFIDYMKIRGSFGQQGYLTSSNHYSFWNRWDDRDDVILGTFPTNNQNRPTWTKLQTGNPNIDWPVKSTINIGTDALLMNRLIGIHLDYFYTMTKGEFARYPYSDMSGGNDFNALYNEESVAGSGLELGLNVSKTIKHFSYSIGINGGYFVEKNKILLEPNYPDENLIREGDPVDAIYGLDANGLFASDAEAAGSNQKFGTVFAQDIRYLDHNGDGIVDDTDEHSIGNNDPRISYGFNLNLRYKGFSFYTNFAGFAGFDALMSSQTYYQQSGYNTRSPFILSDLQNGNPMPRMTVLGSDNNYQNSTYWLVNGGFLRLENIELAYTLPYGITTRWWITKAKIFIRGRNLFSISAFDKVDPEMLHGGYTDYPIFREFSAGLMVSF